MDILHPLYAGKLGRYHGISLEGNTLRMLFHCSSHGQNDGFMETQREIWAQVNGAFLNVTLPLCKPAILNSGLYFRIASSL